MPEPVSVSILPQLIFIFYWPILIFLSYKSKKWWKGLIIGILIWIPIIIATLLGPYVEDKAIGIIIELFFALIAMIIGTICGFIGSRRRKDKNV